MPDFYYDAVLETAMQPPDWHSSIVRISVGTVTRLALGTDGDHFKLWSNTVTPLNVEKFLLDLNRSCQLPADPAEAARLLKVDWQSADLSATRFAEIHKGLVDALTVYAGAAQTRYAPLVAKKDDVVYVDAIRFKIMYHSPYQQIEFSVWDDPKQQLNRPILNWIHRFRDLGEGTFHRPIWSDADFGQ